MLKDLFDKGRCALGLHSGDWLYESNRSCRQIRICLRCKNESRQVVHDWQAWQYVADAACEMARRCGRCREQEDKTEHTWGAPVYGTEGTCTQARPCTRCGKTIAAGTTHVWNSWIYDAKDRCAQTAACARCGETGKETRVSHDWSDWVASQFYSSPVRACRRCGEMAFNLGDGKPDIQSISLQMAHSAVVNVVESQDSDTVRQRIAQHSSVLFSPVTDKYFDFAVDQLAHGADAKNTYRQLATLIDQCRSKGIDHVFNPPPQESSHTAAATLSATPESRTGIHGALDARLVGHWRSTEILGAGSGYSHTIDTHCILEGNGSFQWFSRSSSGINAPDLGKWSAAKGSFTLTFNDGSVRTFEYIREGKTLFCPQESRYRLWERVG